MHKHNIQYLIYYVCGRIFLRCCTQYIFPLSNFLSFIQQYRRYLIIISISYRSYCSLLTEHEKKYQQIRQAIAIGNLYLFLHIFFRPLLNIEPALFLLLGFCIFILRNTRNLPKKIKLPLQIILWILSFFILISGMFYLYPEQPDIKGFINLQNTQLIIISDQNVPKHQTYIALTNLENLKTQEIQIWTGNHKYSLNTNSEIKYLSQTTQNPEQIYLLFPDSTLIQISPQSLIQLSEKQAHITNGIVYTYTPFFETNIDIQWNSQIGHQTIYQEITRHYQQNFINHLKEQIWPIFTNTSIARTINKTALSFLSKLFPWFFSQNVKNYYAFEQYFQTQQSISTEKYNISDQNQTPPNFRKTFKKNQNLWKSNLNIF